MKPVALRLPRAHRVKKPLSGGGVAIYWYRSRGSGDLMMRFMGSSLDEALAAETAGAVALAAIYGAAPAGRLKPGETVGWLITRYKVAPDGFERLAPKTKVNWRRSLDLINQKFGDLPLKALSDRRMKKELIEWRNGFRATPRQADNHMTVLKRLLSWGVENGEIDTNPAHGIEGIYRSNRADLIVEPEDLNSILSGTTPGGARAIRLAAATGLRREDVVNITWDHVHDGYIKFATGKSKGKKTVVVPLLSDARAVIEEAKAEREDAISAGRVPSAYLLLTHRGTPWTPDGLTQSFARSAKKFGIKRTLNDLRGTAITRFVLAGWTDEQVADVVGWEIARVRNIRKHYVDAATVAMGLVTQLENAEKTG